MTARQPPHEAPTGLSRRDLLRMAGATALAAYGHSALPGRLLADNAGGTLLKAFSPPANWEDFPPGPRREQLHRQWSLNVNQWTEQAILGNPWTSDIDQDRYFYFNPLRVPIPDGTPVKLVEWIAFPNRISTYLGPPTHQYTDDQLFEFAENGRLADGTTLPPIPVNVCPFLDSTPLPNMDYGPPGPRGWQDEYCEWAVERNRAGKIKRVMFTCENPEYWYTLWRVDPSKVLQLYHELVNPRVQMGDLQLVGPDGKPVRDYTGEIAYNPLNKWNNSTRLLPDSGGAVHLTSPPNNLGAEIGLGAAASLLRYNDSNPQELVCCTPFGQPFRHSDPHIGFTLNQAVQVPFRITISNPVGLYIQQPDFENMALPAEWERKGLEPSDFWHLVRGEAPSFGLHAVFRAPDSHPDLDLSQITINGESLQWGAQITTIFQIGLHGVLAPPGDIPAQRFMACPNEESPVPNRPAPYQLIRREVFEAHLANDSAGDSSTAAPVVKRGGSLENMALVTTGTKNDTPITFIDPATGRAAKGVSVQVKGFVENQCYHVPGNTGGGVFNIFVVDIAVGTEATTGQLDLRLGTGFNAAGKAYLTVEA